MSHNLSVFALASQNWQKGILVRTMCLGWHHLDSLHGYGKLGLIRGEYHCIRTALLLKCWNKLAFYKPQFTWNVKNYNKSKLSRNVCKLPFSLNKCIWLEFLQTNCMQCKLKKNLMTKSWFCSHTKLKSYISGCVQKYIKIDPQLVLGHKKK